MQDKPDSADLKIIKILQGDAHATHMQLSQATGLSSAAAFERVKKLEQAGIIRGYHARVEPQRIGLAVEAIIEIALTRQVKDAISRFREAMNEIDEITECYQVTGNVDFVVKAVVKDIPAYEKMITEKLGNLDVISSMRTRVILATTKNTKVLPADYDHTNNNKS